MIERESILNFICQTSRLQISEVRSCKQQPEFFVSVMEILTQHVVENLPSNFQNINSVPSAQAWLEQIISDGRLFVVTLVSEINPIGFVFLSTENTCGTHIGYLLGESYWGNGYATEILTGLIGFIESEDIITNLVAGVSIGNLASINLLLKLGFVQRSSEDNGTVFFEYHFSQTQ